MNYVDYLNARLLECREDLGFDIDIKVALERSFKLPANSLLFVVKNLPGSYVYNVRTQPVQIIAYSELNTLNIALQILDLFAKKYNNNTFKENGELIKQNYDTVTVLRPMVEAETGYKASLYLYGSYVICEGIADVENLQWYDEDEEDYVDFNYIGATFGYSAVLDTQKISGVELSESEKREAGAVLSISMPQNNSNLCKIINKIMFGAASGNTNFEFSFDLNDEHYEVVYKLADSNLPHTKTDAPILQLSFSR